MHQGYQKIDNLVTAAGDKIGIVLSVCFAIPYRYNILIIKKHVLPLHPPHSGICPNIYQKLISAN